MTTAIKPIKCFTINAHNLNAYQKRLLHEAVEKSFKPVGYFTYKPAASEHTDVWEGTLDEILDEFPDVFVEYVQ